MDIDIQVRPGAFWEVTSLQAEMYLHSIYSMFQTFLCNLPLLIERVTVQSIKQHQLKS